jgi:acyl carrier protein
MTLGEAREHVLAAIRSATTVIDDPRVMGELATPDGDIILAELDIDSLAAMKMCLDIEDSAGVEINLGDLAVHPTVNKLATFIVARSARK